MMKRGLKTLLAAVLILCCLGTAALASSMESSTLLNNINAELLVKTETGYRSMEGAGGAQAFTGDVYWEPGRTQIAYLKIMNNENASIYAEVVLDVAENDFGTTLEYAVINEELLQANHHPADWAEFAAQAKVMGATGTIQLGENILFSKRELGANAAQYLAVAIHMREDARREDVSFDENGSAVLDMQFKLRSNKFN